MAQIVDRLTIDSDSEQWDWAFDVNVKGSFLMSKAVVPSMRERGGGAIVNARLRGRFPGQVAVWHHQDCRRWIDDDASNRASRRQHSSQCNCAG